jgi:hypothetical protein
MSLVHCRFANDTANCGKGNCSETTVPLPPNYECRCDPGWSHALQLIPFSPCIVPNCSVLLTLLSSLLDL